jgi:hypothetical protein
MALVQEAGNPFEWKNPQWTGGPGTFAIILGVSAYAHVEGGSGPKAKQTYGLGQLPGSARTALEFFEWLETKYRSSSAPLARCYLALSPTEQEKKAEPRMASIPEATFRNCSDAVGLWRNAMAGLHPSHAEKSRSFFFFSGHGMEVHHDKQLLLPADYLRPPLENVNEAISTENLAKGLRSLNVTEQFFFLDACRADHEDLRALSVKGADLLPEAPAAWSSGNLVQPLFYASTPGSAAFALASGDVSVFGQALLDGLEADQGMQLVCVGNKCEVRVFNLASYLNLRVPEILEKHGGNEKMGIRLGGVVMDACITEVPRRVDPSIFLSFNKNGFEGPETEMSMPDEIEVPVIPDGPGDFRPQSRNWDPSPPRKPPEPTASEKRNSTLSPEIAALWSRIKVTDARTGAPVDGKALRVSWFSVAAPGRKYRLGLQNRAKALWLQASSDTQDCACIVPADLDPASFILEVGLGEAGKDIESLFVEADTDTDNYFLKGAARIWQLFRSGRLAEVLAPSQLDRLEGIVGGKVDSPLGGTIAATVLLRLGAFKYLHDWLRILSKRFTEVPDGPVLWMEHLHRDPKWRDPNALKDSLEGRSLEEELALQLTRVSERGLPYSSEGLTFLASLLGQLKGRELPGVPPELVPALTAQVDRALRYFRPDGFSVSFRGPTGSLSPELIRPLKPPT